MYLKYIWNLIIRIWNIKTWIFLFEYVYEFVFQSRLGTLTLRCSCLNRGKDITKNAHICIWIYKYLNIVLKYICIWIFFLHLCIWILHLHLYLCEYCISIPGIQILYLHICMCTIVKIPVFGWAPLQSGATALIKVIYLFQFWSILILKYVY